MQTRLLLLLLLPGTFLSCVFVPVDGEGTPPLVDPCISLTIDFEQAYSERVLNRLAVDFDSCFAIDDFEISCDPHVATLGDCEADSVPKAQAIVDDEAEAATVRCEVVCEGGEAGEAGGDSSRSRSGDVAAPG